MRRLLSKGIFPGQPPRIVVYVPLDGKGPILIGEGDTDYELPRGYDRVTLHGTPQSTTLGGVETRHADDSVEMGLQMAGTDKFSDIFFNRSYTTITGGRIQSNLRSDVVGLYRPDLQLESLLAPYESLSPGQNREEREEQLQGIPGMRMSPLEARRYKILKFLLSLLAKRWLH